MNDLLDRIRNNVVNQLAKQSEPKIGDLIRCDFIGPEGQWVNIKILHDSADKFKTQLRVRTDGYSAGSTDFEASKDAALRLLDEYLKLVGGQG